MKTKIGKPNWKFDLDQVEGDVDRLVAKYRRPDVPPNTTVTTNIDELPEKGFLFVMISRRGDNLTIRQFGHDMDSITIEEGFFKILNSLYLPKKDVGIGIA